MGEMKDGAGKVRNIDRTFREASLVHLIGRYLMCYSFPIYLIGRESKIMNWISRESQSECISSISQSESLHGLGTGTSLILSQ